MIFHTLKRRFVTLIEIMIVMFLIALIIGVLAYNYRGSLDEGKAFKTKAGMDRIETILNLEIAKDPSLRADVANNWYQIISRSPLVNDPRTLATDGWGDTYQVSVDPETQGIRVTSSKYDQYTNANHSLFNNK